MYGDTEVMQGVAMRLCATVAVYGFTVTLYHIRVVLCGAIVVLCFVTVARHRVTIAMFGRATLILSGVTMISFALQ